MEFERTESRLVQSNCQKLLGFEEHAFVYKSLSLLEIPSQTCKALYTVTK